MLFAQDSGIGWGTLAVVGGFISAVTAAVTAALVKLMPEWRLNKQLEEQIKQSASNQITEGFKKLLEASEKERKEKEEKLDEVVDKLQQVMQAEARCKERADWLEKRVRTLEEREQKRQQIEDERRNRRRRPGGNPGNEDEVAAGLSDDELPALNGTGCEEDSGYGE